MSLKSRLAVTALAISAMGSAYIMQVEGVKLKPYLDSAGVPTVCIGSTKNVVMGKPVTIEECNKRYKKDLDTADAALERLVKVPITQNQYDALISFTFNLGEGNLAKSTLLKKINAQECKAAAAEFNRWVYAGGVKLRGLVKRRAEESRLWLTGCPA